MTDKTKTAKKKPRISRAEKDRSTVRIYTHFDELKSCLESGFSPASAKEFVELRFPGDTDIPSELAIRRWRDKHVPTAKVIPHEFILKKLAGVDYKVDVIKSLSRLIPLLEHRLGMGLQMEEQAGMLLPPNDTAAKTLLDAIREFVDIAQDLGLMQSKPPAVFDLSTKNLNIYPPGVEEGVQRTLKLLEELNMLPKGVPSEKVSEGRRKRTR